LRPASPSDQHDHPATSAVAVDSRFPIPDSRRIFGRMTTATDIRPISHQSTNDKVFALSAYFEIMDRVLPTFTNLISDQVFDGTRILLK